MLEKTKQISLMNDAVYRVRITNEKLLSIDKTMFNSFFILFSIQSY